MGSASMFRLFKHYIPHAVLLLAALDSLLLMASAELAWLLRAWQIDMAVESTTVAKIGERIDIGAAFEQLTLLLQTMSEQLRTRRLMFLCLLAASLLSAAKTPAVTSQLRMLRSMLMMSATAAALLKTPSAT